MQSTKGVTSSWIKRYEVEPRGGAFPYKRLWVPPPGKKLGSNKPFRVLCCRSSCWNLPLSIAFLLGVFTRCSCAYESMKAVKQRERAKQKFSKFVWGDLWHEPAFNNGNPRWRPCHEKVSSLFIFRFLFSKKRFSYNPGHYNMFFFVLNSFLSLFSVMVPWNIFVCGLNHSEVSVLSCRRIKEDVFYK